MYEIVSNIINHNWTQGDSAQQYVYYICGALILVLTAVFIDAVIRVFTNFWRRS